MTLARKIFQQNLEESILPFKDQIVQTFTARFFHPFKHKLGKQNTCSQYLLLNLLLWSATCPGVEELLNAEVTDEQCYNREVFQVIL